MKILIISLLRVGDIVLSAPVLRGLRDKYPNAQIHLLLNRQCESVAPMLPYIDQFFYFDRKVLQAGLGQADIPVFDSYDRLRVLIEDISKAGAYDVSINLTQTRLSGWIMSAIEAKERIGLSFDSFGRASFGSKWFRYLNEQAGANSIVGPKIIHYTDIFRLALGLKGSIQQKTMSGASKNDRELCESDEGSLEARQSLEHLGFFKFEQKNFPILAVQALTSDCKKNWSLDKFVLALESFYRIHPGTKIAVIAAPFEVDILQPFVAELIDRGIDASLVVLSLAGAFSFLKHVRAILTLDTSIKHLAGIAGTPIVELSIGSADCNRTGAYQIGSVILQNRETCAPCPHSKACHRSTHACSDRIAFEAVAMVVAEIYAGRSYQLSTIAEEYKEDILIMCVKRRSAGLWFATPVINSSKEIQPS
jgi:ADP-heptose:LPS heptosyltransferase